MRFQPSDPVLQSLPGTYLSLEVKSNDGHSHRVEVYSDISGGTAHSVLTPYLPDGLVEWLTALPHNDSMIWSTRVTDTTIFHQLDLQSPIPFGNESGRSLDASVWYVMLNTVVCPAVIGPASGSHELT